MKPTTSLAIVVGALAFWVILLQIQISHLNQLYRGMAAKTEMLQRMLNTHQHASVRVSRVPSLAPAQTRTVSCYTSRESHGAVGRTDGVSAATWLYPIGTHIYIEGIGERIVETRTARSLSSRVDIWWGSDYESCIQFGIQHRAITLL